MTIYIEDLIVDLNSYINLNTYDKTVVSSFVNQIFSGRGFTEKQRELAVRILKKYSTKLEVAIRKSVASDLSNPQFRFPIRKTPTISNKRIYITDHPNWGKCINAEFPYDEAKIDQIKKNRDKIILSTWDAESKSWKFSLSEANLHFLQNLTSSDSFDFDDEFKEYLDQINQIVNNMENYVPMLVFDNGQVKYKNVSQFVPSLDSTDVIKSIFSARKSGIHTWDENINALLEQSDVHPLVKNFLNNDFKGDFEINSGVEPIDCLKSIVNYMDPCLFVIPGGSELEKTRLVYNFLTGLGYSQDEMSVMFRLSSQDGKDFNDFVKNCGLNNPITDRTKFVFVSIKLPKPVLKTKLKFSSVVSLGKTNVHYTIRDFFKNRENLIYYCEPSKQKEFNFGNL